MLADTALRGFGAGAPLLGKASNDGVFVLRKACAGIG